MDENGQRGGGLLASIGRLGQTALGAFQNRLELFALELQEEKQWLVTTLLWTSALVFCSVLAITTITLTIVVLSPAEARPYVLIGLCLLYVLLAVFAWIGLRKQIKERPPPFSDSISEIKKDVAWLRDRES